MRWKNKASIATLAVALVAICGAGTARADQKAGASYSPPAVAAKAETASGAKFYPNGEPPKSPHGSSEAVPGERRYDEVGYAISSKDAAGFGETGVYAASRTLPADSFAEVTELNGGRTILVKIEGKGPADTSALIDLSPAAARTLGLTPGDRLPVRVRRMTPTGEDIAALANGGPASRRMDAPELVLKALRKKLPAAAAKPAAAAAAKPVAPKSVAVPASKPPKTARPPSKTPVAAKAEDKPGKAEPKPSANGPYYVQVAALSNEARAKALADKLGGYVKAGGGLYRIRVGGFASKADAEQKRAQIARHGYGDARVYRND
ncbi:SPOR domain-containing protein [Stakelama marina]|uniref:SPOR domain-containing protein n=1 Tax=Stakelama marina TaxID=2826939 RepID=A0A8T4IAZ6_9SPHN|nr:SPOR domain-containing protein [Stakelama marina]MBR0551583.1 SPOR domain-containing protein [Stakelama marina]